MQQEQSKGKMNMGVLNGIILGLIGLLVLVTPLTTEVPQNQLKIDIIAGAVLLLGGLVSLLWGLVHKP